MVQEGLILPVSVQNGGFMGCDQNLGETNNFVSNMCVVNTL